MGNLLSLNPKIHRLRADAKKNGGFSHADRQFVGGAEWRVGRSIHRVLKSGLGQSKTDRTRNLDAVVPALMGVSVEVACICPSLDKEMTRLQWDGEISFFYTCISLQQFVIKMYPSAVRLFVRISL
jgi:hypothetical protein